MNWNPRYLAYCAAHGRTPPDDMMTHDDATYPGGKMTGFMLWIGTQWTDFMAAKYPTLKVTSFGYRETVGLCAINGDFDAWQAGAR